MKLDIRTVEPSQLKAELLRLRDVEKMDFLENLIGMDGRRGWSRRGLHALFHIYRKTRKSALFHN